MQQDLRESAALMEDWVHDQALRHWANSGFDWTAGRFEERLTPDGSLIRDVPIRLLVQARQIYVYSLAVRRRWHPKALALVEHAFGSMKRDYHNRDGRQGWVTSITRAGAVADSTKDLYAHAFVLLAVASYVEATGNHSALSVAEETIAFLDREMKAPRGGGYIETWPDTGGRRRQNPHMHLFEAMLALWQCSRERTYLRRADELYDLMVSHFFLASEGVLIEYFDEDLQPAPGTEGLIVEPGHHYEWCWLLRWYEREANRKDIGPIVDALLGHSLRFGHDSEGLILDEVLVDGSPRLRSRRLWPMTEAIKCNLAEGERGRAGCMDRAADLVSLLHGRFIAPAAQGAWFDRLDASGNSAGDFVPASSLYHLVGATEELRRVTSK